MPGSLAATRKDRALHTALMEREQGRSQSTTSNVTINEECTVLHRGTKLGQDILATLEIPKYVPSKPGLWGWPTLCTRNDHVHRQAKGDIGNREACSAECRPCGMPWGGEPREP